MGSYDTTLGTLLIGIFFNTFLYGLVTYQFAAYYRSKFNDRPLLKCMVLFLFILDTFHTASAIYMAWSYTVTNYDNPAALALVKWPHTITPLATALAAFVTQIYLGSRIWRLTKSMFLYGVVILLALPSFTVATFISIKARGIQLFSELPRLTPFAVTWLATQVVVDTFITTTLVVVLARSRTGFRTTDAILSRFIRGAVQTGLFAGIFAICDLITFVLLPNMNLYGMFAIPLGRIYTNTLLDILLSRKSLQAATDSAENAGVVIDSVYWPPIDSQATQMVQSTGTEIQIRKSAHETRDRSLSEGAGGEVV